MTGDAWEAFKESIKTSGIIEPIVVTKDMTIISGHQRYKAAKELGIKMIPIRIREDLIDEDKKLKVLLAANFGRSKNDDAKQRKVAVEYVRLCGYGQGGDRKSNCQLGSLKLSDIANQLGTSERNLARALSIERNLTESMKELLDTGVISKTVASDVIASLSKDEQEELIKSMDITKKITQKEVQQYINEIKQLKENPEIKELKDKISDLQKEKSILEQKVKIYQTEADRYNKLKSDIEFLTQQKNDIGRQITSSSELAGLTVRLQNLLETELAPIKFKRCMENINNDEVCMGNLMDIIHKLDSWSDEMKRLLNNDYIVDVQ